MITAILSGNGGKELESASRALADANVVITDPTRVYDTLMHLAKNG